MANWAKEIMKLANDFCLNMNKAREIIEDVDKPPIPNGRIESEYKYDKAHVRLKKMIIDAL